jgi:hypothetical protein
VKVAWILIGFVFLEVAVLLANWMKCPLTTIASAIHPSARTTSISAALVSAP